MCQNISPNTDRLSNQSGPLAGFWYNRIAGFGAVSGLFHMNGHGILMTFSSGKLRKS
jgi:hypothetical protein